MQFEIYQDDKGWRWCLRGANGRIVADPGESFKSQREVLEAIALVKGTANIPVRSGGPKKGGAASDKR